jgi:hypothetical protein
MLLLISYCTIPVPYLRYSPYNKLLLGSGSIRSNAPFLILNFAETRVSTRGRLSVLPSFPIFAIIQIALT